ncbi:EF-P beta-lysylation protein EpmB [Candidatus Sororendozoicomonas aggregata]|uniref:EF-P beta-lysylation protein EpmB n=1 Tax=Candidatus Sororendozoicomonas aggregata TaxID=3073239 RepID=UPI002ED5EDD0
MPMITRSTPTVHTINATEPESWQQKLSTAVNCPEQLLDMLGLDRALLPDAVKAGRLFSLRVPRGFVAKMERGNPNDPLLLQVLPLGQELLDTQGYSFDPLNEIAQNPCNGVIHKYPGRLLLITSGACAINCRFCFRRHFPYGDNQLSGEDWDNALRYIVADTSIKEVILSGGDPLATSDKRLKKLAVALSDIPHVETLRIHTRLPLVIPERITDEMIHWFTGTRLKPVMVIHCNHANEIDGAVQNALNQLQQARVMLLNQTVLLKGINDSVDVLVDLSQALFQSSVLPYYLHVLDKVQGAAHFDVDEQTAACLVNAMQKQCPGYLVPKLVREIAGKPGKTPVTL